jgi:GntR family transcriptional regulator/MocR family aminotransferase
MDIADILLPLDETSDVPLYRQVYEGLRGAILEGRFAPGTRLPSTRRLAEYLAVSRTTVLVAFEQLAAEGFVESRVGSGSRVTERLPPPDRPDETGSRAQAETSLELLSRLGRSLAELPRPPRELGPGPRAFRTGQPPVDGFPLETWRRLAARRHRTLSTADLYHGSPWGLRELREAIVTVAVARGIRCDPRQVMVLASAQEAMELVCRALLDPGDQVWLEDPAWSGGHGAILAAGARPVPVQVDQAGLRVDHGLAVAPRARLVYVTPSHQYPMGVVLSLERRQMLLDWATEQGAWILEDDYDSEFRYADRPLPALQCLDRTGRVIYVGTFNKVLFPALRLGYLILPEALIEGLGAARAVGAQHPPAVEQGILADFIQEGHFARYLQHARALGRERRDALFAAAGGLDGLELQPSDTGLHTVGWLPPGTDDRDVNVAALRHGVEAASLSAYYLGRCPRPGLVLGYGSLTVRQIRDGMERLAAALEEVVAGEPSARD